MNKDNKSSISISHPAILEELWEGSTFDDDIYSLLEQYTTTQEAGELDSNSPKVQKLTQNIYHHLTTTRNRNLINQNQQKMLRRSVGAFFGLSTGSHAAITWTMQSRANTIKIVDPDTISPSNLNRMRFGWDSIGKYKTEVVKEEVNRISPYTKIISTTKTDLNTQEKYFSQKPKTDFIVEAIDDLESKIRLRQLAKKYKLPYLMATDVGDNVFLDIERYDLTPQPKLFNGRVKNIEKIDFDHLYIKQKVNLAMQIVGLEHNSEAMLSSLLNIGKTVGTWPQLAATANMAGSIITTAIIKILLGERVVSGRYYFSLDDILVSDFNSKTKVSNRQQIINQIHNRFSQ